MQLKIKLYDKQRQFLRSTARYTCYGGARGGGKSFVARILAITLSAKYAGLKTLILRRTLPELRENHIKPLLGMLHGAPVKYKDAEKCFYFSNGSEIKLGYCDNDGDVLQYQGQEYDVIIFEEATQFTEYMLDFILTCLRTTREDFKPRAYYTCNPGGPGHAYIKKRFIDKSFGNPDDFLFIQALVGDNKVLMQTSPDYVDVLNKLPSMLRKAHLLGDWNVFIGQVFDEFETEKHVVKPYTLPSHYQRFISLDWGYSAPYAVLWGAIDYDGNIIIYRELYGGSATEKGKGVRETPAQVAKKIKQLTGSEDITWYVADPSIWSKNDGSYSVYEQFLQHGVPFIKAKNDRLQGWMQIHTRLKSGSLKFFSTCSNIIEHLPALQYDKNNVEDVDTTGIDHDCMAGGTLITTARGDVPIEKVKCGDMVLTRSGYRRVLVSGKTKTMTDVIRIKTDNAEIVCTTNHPIFINGGWKRAADIMRGDLCSMLTKSTFAELCSEDTRTANALQTENTIVRLLHTLKTALSTCIRKYGDIITAKFRKAFTSIILMAIRLITPSITFSALRRESTCNIITAGTNAKRVHGTQAKPEEYNTANKLKNYGITWLLKNMCVCFAKKNLKRSIFKVARLEQIISVCVVRIAEKHLKQTNIANRSVAHMRVVSILDGGKADTYNLAVEQCNEFFANGILSHNCDALRYGCMLRVAASDEPKTIKRDAWDDYDYKSKDDNNTGWMSV